MSTTRRSVPPTESVGAPCVGQLLAGRYRIEGELGEGGMGSVYRALDEGRGERVALKVVKAGSARRQELFEREYQTLAKLAHPSVIVVHDFGSSEQGSYYTMELLAGGDLNAPVPLPWRTTCLYLRDVCTSLALLHAQRLVHRDVNPRNVRMDALGRAKLLDFGALTMFGPASEIVGAPPCIAPEGLRGLPLDGRTDLFSLGVVAYYVLTARLPFAIRQLPDAEAAWQLHPLPPSRHTAEIPAALDELVLSLLSIDPLGRPASAADVIDRLDALTMQDDELVATIAQSHIASAPLVGRASEQAELDLLLSRVTAGRGVVVTVETERGGGKTRMLTELRVMAQLVGLRSIMIKASGKELAIYHELLRGLFEVAPEAVRASSALGASALQPMLDAQRRQLAAPAALTLASAEDHVKLQSALAALVLEVCARHPILVCIDDAHELRPETAGMLLPLAQGAHSTSLMLAVSYLPLQVAPAVQQMVYMGTSLRLSRLPLSAIEMLVQSTFGEGLHRARLAHWLFEASQGHPGNVHAMLHELVTRGVLRYAAGSWMIPGEIDEAARAHVAFDRAEQRLTTLSPLALSLARMLAVHHGPLSAHVLLQSGWELGPDKLSAAVRELVTARLCEESDGGVELSHQNVRRALREALDAREHGALHERLAQALQERDADAVAALHAGTAQALSTASILNALAVGYHRLCAGQDSRGIKLLRNGSLELTIRGEGLTAAARHLEPAVELMRMKGYDRIRCTPLMTSLTLAGTYADWRLSYRYGDEVLAMLAKVSGLELARRMRPLLGGRIAFYLALGLSFVLFQLLPKRRITDDFRTLMLGLMGIGSAILGVCSVLQDRQRAEKVCQILAPLAFFPESHPVRWVYGFQLAMRAQAAGDYLESHRRCLHALSQVRSEAARRVLPERARVQLEGGVLLCLGQLEALRTDGSVLKTLRATEQLDSPTLPQTLASSRVAFHGHRGEREAFMRALEQMDRLAALSGSTWRNDLAMPRMMWSTHLMCEDVMSLKRCVQLLDPLSAHVPTVERLRDIIQACYLCERGMPREALQRFESVLSQSLDNRGLRALQERAAFVRILRKAGEHARAVQVAEEGVALLGPEEAQFTVIAFALHAELALALASDGRLEAAVALSDRLLRGQTMHDNPLLHGLAHALRAQLALSSSDWPAYTENAQQMYEWVRGTQHPALIGQWQRLTQRARSMQTTPANDVSREDLPASFDTVDTDIS